MSILQRIRYAGLVLLFLLGAGLLGYLALEAYRNDLMNVAVRSARSAITGEVGRYSLRVGDGVSFEPRDKLAESLKGVAWREPFGVDLAVVPTSGTKDALDKVAGGELDVAFVHGVVEAKGDVYQVAALATVPLHMLVDDKFRDPLTNQRGHRFWLDSEGTGTHDLATKVLDFARNDPENVFTPEEFAFEQLQELENRNESKRLPRVIFLASSLPSPFAEVLIKSDGYKLEDLPLARALAIRHYGVQEAEIPEFTYGCPNGASDRPVRTVGTRLLMVASRHVQAGQGAKQEAVLRLLSAMYESDFARRANLPQLDEGEMDRSPEFPLCTATRRFRDRHQTVFTGENIQSLEALGSLVIGGLMLLVLPWRILCRASAWWRFDSLRREADGLRREILRAMTGRGAIPTAEHLAGLDGRLRALRIRVTEDYVHGRLPTREQFDRLGTYLDRLEGELAEALGTATPRLIEVGSDRSPALVPTTPN